MTTTTPEGTPAAIPAVTTTVPGAVKYNPVPTPPPVAAAPAAPAVPPVATSPAPVDNGFPPNVPPGQMTQEQQLAYWQHYSRHHEQLWKSVEGIKAPEVEALRAKAAELEQLKLANATDQERAVLTAAATARAEALKEITPRLVAAEFRAATAGRVTPEQLQVILDPLDTSKFVDTAGNVDVAKVTAFVAGIAPVAPGALPPGAFPAMGQGTYPGGAKPSVAAGKDMYAAQKPKTT